MSTLEIRSANASRSISRLDEGQVLCNSLCEGQREKVEQLCAQMNRLQASSAEISTSTKELDISQAKLSSDAVHQIDEANANGEAMLQQLEESTHQLAEVTTENAKLRLELDTKTSELASAVTTAAAQCEQYQAALISLRGDAAALEQELHSAREHASLKV